MCSFSGNCAGSVPFFTFMCLWAIYIRYAQDRFTYFPAAEKDRSIVGIYKSFTDTWMWNLGLWPCNSFSGNICFEFSVFSECRTVPVLPKKRSLFNLNILLIKNYPKLNWQMYFFADQLLQKCSWEKSRKSSGLRCIEEESEIPRIKLSQVRGMRSM
jgi:hypothetical protein